MWAVHEDLPQNILPPRHRLKSPTVRHSLECSQWGEKMARACSLRLPRLRFVPSTLPELVGPRQDWETKRVSLRLYTLSRTQPGHQPPVRHGQPLDLLPQPQVGQSRPSATHYYKKPKIAAALSSPDSLPPRVLSNTQTHISPRGLSYQ